MEILDNLSESLRTLPGVGEKTAKRYAYQLIEKSSCQRQAIITALKELDNLKKCQNCNNYTFDTICDICKQIRSKEKLILVHNAKEIDMIEKILPGKYYYHVVNEIIDPLNGVNPEDLNIEKLKHRVSKLKTEELIVILPTNLEGELTTNYIKKCFEKEVIKVSTLAQGVPIGGNIEYLDEITLLKSYQSRQQN